MKYNDIDSNRKLDFSSKVSNKLPIRENNFEITTEEELLIKALDEFEDNKNFKYALLDSFISAETAIMKFVNKLKLENGVSKNKLDDYKEEVSISYVINIEIPFLVENLTDDERSVLGRINRVRKIRNDVVHNGKNVTEQEAREAINAVFDLLKFIEPEKYKLICRDL